MAKAKIFTTIDEEKINEYLEDKEVLKCEIIPKRNKESEILFVTEEKQGLYKISK